MIHPNFNDELHESTKLWRYMDFAKFTSMLMHESLYFSRFQYLGDPWEGVFGLKSRKEEDDQELAERIRADAAEAGYPDISGDEVREMIAFDVKRRNDFLAGQCVSCWHENEAESESQWRIYGSLNATSVAVETNLGKLKLALQVLPWGTHSPVVRRVRYVDYRTERPSGLQAIFHKRRSLAHENEVRAVILFPELYPGYLMDEHTRGVNVPVDLRKLVTRVVVSPFAPGWFREVVEETIGRFHYKLPVDLSEIGEGTYR